jgi:hypothetical protein
MGVSVRMQETNAAYDESLCYGRFLTSTKLSSTSIMIYRIHCTMSLQTRIQLTMEVTSSKNSNPSARVSVVVLATRLCNVVRWAGVTGGVSRVF